MTAAGPVTEDEWAAHRRRHGRALYRLLDMAREFIDACAMWARAGQMERTFATNYPGGAAASEAGRSHRHT